MKKYQSTRRAGGLLLNIVAAATLAFSLYAGHNRIIKRYNSSQHDLRAYIACAHNILSGRHIYKTHHRKIPEDPTLTSNVPKYLYPPLMGMLMIPASLMPYADFKNVWFFLNIFFVLGSIGFFVAALPKSKLKTATFFFSAAIIINAESLDWLLRTAQADAFVLFLSVLSLFFYTKKNFFISALLIVVASWAKVTPGLLCLLLVTRGNKKFIIYAAVFSIALFLAQLIAVGDQFFYFFTKTLTKDIPGPMRAPIMQSLWSLTQLALAPYKKRLILDYPHMTEPVLTGLKIFVIAVSLFILIRRSKTNLKLAQAFAALSCVSMLITDTSWVMRFVWSTSSISLIVFFVLSLPKRLSSLPAAIIGIAVVLLNCSFLLHTLLGPLSGWKAIFIGGSGLSAFFSMIYITVLSLGSDKTAEPNAANKAQKAELSLK